MDGSGVCGGAWVDGRVNIGFVDGSGWMKSGWGTSCGCVYCCWKYC